MIGPSSLDLSPSFRLWRRFRAFYEPATSKGNKDATNGQGRHVHSVVGGISSQSFVSAISIASEGGRLDLIYDANHGNLFADNLIRNPTWGNWCTVLGKLGY